ncbi:glycosyltransferase family 8 protein [Streptomyces sp. NPDC026589]|uniref:glycosyltransferase family 8 protein n=1 Tax=Streptomyces sp. NPDC026589 TaxID=3155609 RepID=UPI0033E92664
MSPIPRSGPRPSPALAPLVFSADDCYVLPLLATFSSLAAANAHLLPDLRCLLLHEDLSESAQRRVRSHADRLGLRVELTRMRLPDVDFKVNRGASRANYFRLSLGELLPDENRALYLDADLLVLGDLEPLLTTELAGELLAAVRDPVNPVYAEGFALPGWERLGIKADQEYFNSGVMLLDLARCRAEHFFERCFTFLRERPECIRLWDQDVLNWAAGDRWRRLDRAWNTFAMSALTRTPYVRYRSDHLVPLTTLVAEEEDAKVLHYASTVKPWVPGYPPGPALDRYRAVLDSVHLAEAPDQGGGR